jgi:acyl-CoA synthetase (AMP-forming)/AMP-acid ligase II
MLHLSGRASDVINVGGFKVSPAEVEAVAMSNPLVSDCICISASHPVTGRALKLLVVTPSDQTLDKRSLARYLADRLEPYKVPMLYEQVDTIARTYNGKLDRKHYLQEG